MNGELINTPKQMQKLKEAAKKRTAKILPKIGDEAQEDIDRLNSDFRRYIDVFYAGGNLRKLEYLKLVLQLRATEALEKRKGK